MASNLKINSFLVISFIMVLIMISTAESTGRHLLTPGCKVTCTNWVAVEMDETCTTISEANRMTVNKFLTLNPNLVCEKMFADEWVCIEGTGC